MTAVDLVAVPEWGEITGRWGDRVRFRTGNVADLGTTGEFDAVLDNGCLHHQHPGEYRSYLGALRAALRPAGLLAVSFFVLQPGADRGVLHLEDDGRLAREFTEEEATALIGGTGFAVVGAQRIQRARPERAYLVVTARRAGN